MVCTEGRTVPDDSGLTPESTMRSLAGWGYAKAKAMRADGCVMFRAHSNGYTLTTHDWACACTLTKPTAVGSVDVFRRPRSENT